MAWEECVKSIKDSFAKESKVVKEIPDVNWAGESSDNLDNDTYALGNPFYLICPDRHCTSTNLDPIIQRLCHCVDISGKPIPDCNPKYYLYPYKTNVCLNVKNPSIYSEKTGRACTKQGNDYYPLSCLCCCSCFAYGTKIDVPSGTKKIQDFILGDQVTAGYFSRDDQSITFKWEPETVSFSSGTGEGSHQASMVYIRFGEQNRSIIVTCDHLFMLSSGKLMTADRLIPGIDFFVNSEGESQPINEISIGSYEGGVHHIATEKDFLGDLNGHLLLSEGVVSGDFSLQIHSSSLYENGYFEADYKTRPRVGTKEYEEQHGQNITFGMYKNFKSKAAASLTSNESEAKLAKDKLERKFYVYGENKIHIPKNAAAYLTDAQAKDVMNNSQTHEFIEMREKSALISYTLKFFTGFFEKITFCYDDRRLEANAYAFKQFNKGVVVLTNGLARIKELDFEGYALIICAMITRLQQSSPLDSLGYTSVAMSDYYSFVPMQTVFYGDKYTPAAKSGIKQLEKGIFSSISDENTEYYSDPYKPSTEKRLDALDAGAVMGYPPEGIGGPELYGLKLLNASVSLSSVKLEFNQPVSSRNATFATNYDITPKVEIESVELEDNNKSFVTITGVFTTGTQYNLTVKDYLRAENGSTLDPDQNNVSFIF